MSKIRGLCLCLVTQRVLNWAFTALTAQFHPAQPSVIAVVWRETRVEQNACTSHHCIIVIQPQLKLDCACGRGVQKYCFLLWWCWNTSREGAYYVVTGGGTSTVSENPDVFFFIYTVFKHCWIFIHVAEAGLPCKCILQVFHLPNPSCTSDNLQCYFCS